MKKLIYLDNAATTPVRPEVLADMEKYFSREFINPSSKYRAAGEPYNALCEARRKVAQAIGAIYDEEIYFLSGGTEADNWAVSGITEAFFQKNGKPGHIITTSFEHHGLLYACKHMEKRGWAVTYLSPNGDGVIDPADVAAAIRPYTALISVMFANNEIGTVQPIMEIGAIARRAGVPFHTDAVQAVGHVPVDVVAMNIDLLSMSAHKFYGPKGVGALYIRKGVNIIPMIYGGMQEWNKRAGTHNVPGIVGMGKALELACEELEQETERVARLRDRLIDGILNKIPYVKLNGGARNRLPGIINLSFRFIESESILNLLDFKGVCASSGSACTSDSLEPSHVLTAIGVGHEEANGAVRFSLGMMNTDGDIDVVLESLPPIIEKLRNISPLYEDYIKARLSSASHIS